MKRKTLLMAALMGGCSLQGMACLLYTSRPAQYFHENMDVYKVLEQIRQHNIKYGLICDEFGSCLLYTSRCV